MVSRPSVIPLLFLAGSCGGAASSSPPTAPPQDEVAPDAPVWQLPFGAVSAPSGPYLGQEVPGREPLLFAPGLLSTATGLNELNAAFSPEGSDDGSELFYSYSVGQNYYLMQAIMVDGVWQQPHPAPFASGYNDVDPYFSPDGETLYFISQRPPPSAPQRRDWNIWAVQRDEGGAWGQPRLLPESINTVHDELYPSVTASGVLYFTRNAPDGLGHFDVYRAAPIEEDFQVTNVGAPVNTAGPELNVAISPDERHLVITGSRQGHEGIDLFVARRRDGTFEAPRHLAISSPAMEYCPIFSPDGRYLFFTSFRSSADGGVGMPHTDSIEWLRKAQNGAGDLYWVSADVLEDEEGI